MNERELYSGIRGIVSAIDRLTAAIDAQTGVYLETTARSHKVAQEHPAVAREHLAIARERVVHPGTVTIEELVKLVTDQLDLPFAGGGSIDFGRFGRSSDDMAFDQGLEDAFDELPPQSPDAYYLEGYVDELCRQEDVRSC